MAPLRGAVFASLLILAAAVALPFAAGSSEMTEIVFIGPAGRAIGETLDIRIETFRYALRMDPDDVRVQVGQHFPQHLIGIERIGVGVYTARYTIQAGDIGYLGYLDFTVYITVGSVGSARGHHYFVEGAYGSAGTFVLQSRVINREAIGATLDPGETAQMEVRSYLNGTMRDAGFINSTVLTFPSGDRLQNLTVSRSGGGIYSASFTAPRNLTNTSIYQVGFILGEGYTAPTTAQAFVVDPIPAFVDVRLIDPTHASVDVLLGTDEPRVGARVNLTGTFVARNFNISDPGPKVVSVDLQTNASGGAGTTMVVPSDILVGYIAVNISAGGLSVWRLFPVDPSSLEDGGRPSGSGFLGWLDNDPTDFQRGDTAQLNFHFEKGYLPAANMNVTYYLWRDSEQTVLGVANATTDSVGDLTISYQVPLDWQEGEALGVQVVEREGSGQSNIAVRFDPAPPGGDPDLVLNVQRGAVGAPLRVRATYTGTGDAASASAFAFLIPTNLSEVGVPVYLTVYTPPTGVALARDGRSFEGAIDVPAHYPPGDYTVVVVVANTAAVDALVHAFTASNFSVVHVGPQGSLEPTTPPGGGLLPGPAAFAAVAALGAAGVLRRRRARK